MRIDKSAQIAIDRLVVGAVRAWGEVAQITMLAEECIELAHAALKLLRSSGKSIKARENVIEEIADVILMINQIRYILEIEDSEIEVILFKKIVRTKKRIEECIKDREDKK